MIIDCHSHVQPEKCLYGTDWPIATMESYLEFMEELKIAPKDRQLMLHQNAVRLFRLPVSTSPLGGGGLFGRL